MKNVEMSNVITLDAIKDLSYDECIQAARNQAAKFNNFIYKAKVSCKAYGSGYVLESIGTDLDNIIINIRFSDFAKRFSLKHLMFNTNFVTFDNMAVVTTYHDLYEVYSRLSQKIRAFEEKIRQLKYEEAKKADAEKKAKDKYQRSMEQNIKDFNRMSNRNKDTYDKTEEFYYALGWLAAHVGTITAKLPDYLGDAFKKYFGDDAVCTLVDAKKKTSGGYSMQWAWSFKASLKKVDEVPEVLTQYLSTSGKDLSNTEFIWDLVEDYGFKFGKVQDIDLIIDNIPDTYRDSFEDGYNS
jgi:hypothetical protein